MSQLRGKHTATRPLSHFDSRQRFERAVDDTVFLHHDARADQAAGVFVSGCSVLMPAAICPGGIARHGMASVAALGDRHLSSWRAGHREGSVGVKASGRHTCTGLYLYLAI